MLILYVHAREGKFIIDNFHLHRVAYCYFAGKYLLAQRILHPLLYCAAQRARAVFGIEPFAAYKPRRVVGDYQLNISFLQPRRNALQHQLGYGKRLLPLKRGKQHNFINPVQKLRLECALELVHHCFARAFGLHGLSIRAEAEHACLGCALRAGVAGHYYYRVSEIYAPAA